jgi:hypothetical protein
MLGQGGPGEAGCRKAQKELGPRKAALILSDRRWPDGAATFGLITGSIGDYNQ